MAQEQSQPGDVIDLLLGKALGSAETQTLIETEQFELLRVVLAAGKKSSTHQATDEAAVQCLEGHVKVTAAGKIQDLRSGQLLFLAAAEPNALEAIENSSLLVTIHRTVKKSKKLDVVQEASEESFPASDPPTW